MSASIETRLFLSGSFIEPHKPSTFPLSNPSGGQHVADVHEAGLEDVNRAVDAAKEAQPAWAALSGAERAAKLEKLAQLIERDGQKIGEVSRVETSLLRLGYRAPAIQGLLFISQDILGHPALSCAGLMEQQAELPFRRASN